MAEQMNRCSCGKTFNSQSELQEHKRHCQDAQKKEQQR
jgi:hypothetical protein